MTCRPATTQGALRVLRGSLLAGTSAALAVFAHAAAGGGLPDIGLTLLLTALVAAAGVALAQRRHNGLAVLAALGGTHLGMHLILSAADSGRMPVGRVNDTLMLAAHTAAVLVAAVLLTKADAAIVALAAVLSMLLPRRFAPLAVLERPSTSRATVRPADRVLAVLLRRACARRGPPLSCR